MDAYAFSAVLADAKDDATNFYQRYGFQPIEDAEQKLFSTLLISEQVWASLKHYGQNRYKS